MIRDRAVEASQAVAEDLTPRLADAYDVDLDTPEFKGTMAGYVSMGTAMQYQAPPRDPEEYGVDPGGTVKVREDRSWFYTDLATTVGHELGHAALYQNSDFKAMREDEEYDTGVLDTISEGVAQHFERTAYRALGIDAVKRFDIPEAAGYGFRYTLQRGGQRLWDHTVGRKWPGKYSSGRTTMTGMSRDAVRDVIQDPDGFYQELVADL